ncbi:radical SAM protein [Bradyrhizobium murdochi]|uniref:radical SAM protein n=1 Tax=Bradyrhizobium murdochi TaxID=1038859 RepID=UPI00040B0CF6|nr:radical SAM protein [Bradyrhizobium murdochi]
MTSQGGRSAPTPRHAPYNEFDHYLGSSAPTNEFGTHPETAPALKNIGWTLGNDCPYRCTHCYSMNARRKGSDMSVGMIDRIVNQLAINGIETVNLGGNEPLFTNGLDPKKSHLPYIVETLHRRGIEVGLTTSGITLLYLFRHHRPTFDLLNDVDVSFDSPFEAEHNKNRGANIYHQAIECLRICQEHGKPHTCIMCAMSWNFSPAHIDALVALARRFDANVRINPMKPVRAEHLSVALPARLYYDGFSHLMRLCDAVDLGEPPIATVTGYRGARRCPCGRTSFRIHSITPNGEVPVSPCVYLHDYKSTLDLLRHDLVDIIQSPQFRVFRQRNANPDYVRGCAGCVHSASCGGGCSARSYLHQLHHTGEKTMLAADPYCPAKEYGGQFFPRDPRLISDQRLVHMDYLCTWIGRPKNEDGPPDSVLGDFRI